MIGNVAKCRRGLTGLILRVVKTESDLVTGNATVIYRGICLDEGRVGLEWQSIEPEWIGTLDDWVKLRHIEIAESERAVNKQAVFALLYGNAFDTPTKRNLST